MRQLEALNSQRFFCECGVGEKGNCPGYHVPKVSEPGSRERHILILSAMAAIGLIVLAFGFWV